MLIENIIQDILRQTIIPYCNNKTDREILSYKFTDISCGSGAFLLEAYQLVIDILIDYYKINDKSKLIQTSVDTFVLPFYIKKQLLTDCIYGVDKDYNAVEAARFGLLLKLLEDESSETLTKELPVLPDLSKNIIFVNSLIDPSEKTKGKEETINPLSFGSTKYDVLFGTPPYMSTEDMKNITPEELPIYKSKYYSAYKQFDKYYLFVEKCINLLKPGGYLGYIVPSKFTKVGAAKKLRELLSSKQLVNKIISFGANQIFKGKTTYTCLLIVQNHKQEKTKYYEVRDYKNWVVRDYTEEVYETINSNTLSSDTWTLIPAKLKDAFNIVVSSSERLEILLGEKSITNGIQTSKNSLYIVSPTKIDDNYAYFVVKGKEWKIEKESLRPY
jgi:type I restriction-modification system DNA methylase subunit